MLARFEKLMVTFIVLQVISVAVSVVSIILKLSSRW